VIDVSVAALLAREADAVVAVLQPIRLEAVGAWYEDFNQTTDEEVIDLLHRIAESE
jgi:putative phosphoribosyl transferase